MILIFTIFNIYKFKIVGHTPYFLPIAVQSWKVLVA